MRKPDSDILRNSLDVVVLLKWQEGLNLHNLTQEAFFQHPAG